MSALPATRVVPYVVAPGPLPPRWERVPGGYEHAEVDLHVWLYADGTSALTSDLSCATGSLAIVVADLADLVAWLRRGGALNPEGLGLGGLPCSSAAPVTGQQPSALLPGAGGR